MFLQYRVCTIRSFIVRHPTEAAKKIFSLTLSAAYDWLNWLDCHVEMALLSGSPTNATAGAFL